MRGTLTEVQSDGPMDRHDVGDLTLQVSCKLTCPNFAIDHVIQRIMGTLRGIGRVSV